VVIGGIEASLRRIAHYDYWSDKVRRSVLPDSKADLLLFGNAERALVELAHRLAAGEPIESIRDLRGTAFMVQARLEARRTGSSSIRPPWIRRGGGQASRSLRDPPALGAKAGGPSNRNRANPPQPPFGKGGSEQPVRFVSARPSASPPATPTAPTPSSACRPTSR
jgi:radical SAM superfamily enzyme YgiQ (UPF0313 family)